jgi:hypothetical protein
MHSLPMNQHMRFEQNFRNKFYWRIIPEEERIRWDENKETIWKKKSEKEQNLISQRSHSRLVIFLTEDKFPSCSKVLEVIGKRNINVSNFDRINADYIDQKERLSDLKIKLRVGGADNHTIKNFDT